MSKPTGLSRRVFINRSLTAAGSVMVLSQASALPAWAGEVAEGTAERMARIAFDPESNRTLVSLLQVDVTTREIDTPWGPTKAAEAVDRVLVKVRGAGPYSRPRDVAAGQPHAKLDPRIAARAGKACVTWAAMDHQTRRWSIFATWSDDQKNWGPPREIAGGERPALHPEITMDPRTGVAWIAYEDWADGSVRLLCFDGRTVSDPVIMADAGRNFRPRPITTNPDGPHQGAVAVAWDAYRDGQYDVYLRLHHPRAGLGPEHRVTQSPEWDNRPDLCEDSTGNIWVVWLRASTELSNHDRLRVVHARFFDGTKWRWPASPKGIPRGQPGRITGQATSMHPTILADRHNRVHLFLRDCEGMMWGFLFGMTYHDGAWSKRRKVHDAAVQDVLNMIWDYGVTLDNHNRALTVWDSLYVKRLAFNARVHPTFPFRLPPAPKTPAPTAGFEADEPSRPGWPVRPHPEPPTMELDGKTFELRYGDTHSHSWQSDGIDPPDWHYHYARDKARLDYYALSDHDFTISHTPGLEAYIAFLPKHFNRPGFTCFQAYEFSSQKTGHRVVVFEGDDNPTFPYAYPPKMVSNTNDELYPFLRKFALKPDSRVLVTAHNMYQLGNNFTGHDPGLEPLYDVTSLHILAEKPFKQYEGENEKQKTSIWVVIGKILDLGKTPEQKELWNMCWREALNDGLLLGAYGSSDTHHANGIGFVVSALWVEQNSRASIFDAMFARRSFAIDSAIRLADCDIHPGVTFEPRDENMLRPAFTFHLGPHFMGTEIKLSEALPARVVVEDVFGRDPVSRVVIVKDGVDTHVIPGDGRASLEASWTDPDFTPGRAYYYARAEFASGKVAFSSPVFVSPA